MKKDPDIFDDDIKIEALLQPKAEFRVSTGFKQKVIADAKAMPSRRRRRWIPLAAAYAAAAIAALVILTILIFHHPETPAVAPSVTASVEVPALPTSDTVNHYPPTPLIAKETPHSVLHTQPAQRRTARKKSPSKAVNSPQYIRSEESGEVLPPPVTEGEMPKTSREGPLDPDDVRTHILETRRNAEIAYIEQMREEIEANQAYIAQLMAETNVNQ